jgi:hypothetical protein
MCVCIFASSDFREASVKVVLFGEIGVSVVGCSFSGCVYEKRDDAMDMILPIRTSWRLELRCGSVKYCDDQSFQTRRW